ncbi:MAG TPA: asparaginase [Thermomicrobiales bacterium]|nr:asparaginase [Thermomicrobiales bacterium]
MTNDTEKASAVAVLAEVTRGDVVESVHRGAVAVIDVEGRLVASAGNVDHVTYFRSAAKPFQAIPVIESGGAEAFGFTEREVALSCSSHDSTPEHQRGVARMLEKIGLHEDDLRCGISPIADEQEQARSVLGLVWPSQLQCECSGEHAGMLAACKQLGYPLDTYVERDHPLQRRILEIVAAVLRMDEDKVILGTDGCSIPTFAAPIRRFASAYATLACPQKSPIENDAGLVEAIDRMRDAMVAYPVMIGNEGVLDTEIMQATGGRIVAKLGAEGLLCLAAPERGWGIAITSDDGMPRGLGPAAISTLEQLELADDRDLCGLREQFAGAVPSFKGEPVGAVRPALKLQVA